MTPGVPDPTCAASKTGFGASAGTSAVTASYGNATPNPDSASRPAGPISFAVANTRATTCRFDNSGCADHTKAITPDTKAVLMLVPDGRIRRPSFGTMSMCTPGAAKPMYGAVFDWSHTRN